MCLHIRGEADAVSPMVVFAVSGSRAALLRRGGPAEAAAFPLLKRAGRAGLARQAVRWMGAGSDGRRKAPLSAAAAGLKWPDRCLKPRSELFVVRVAQEAGRLAAHSLCELSMVFIHRRLQNAN